jgi:hypothetical protein
MEYEQVHSRSGGSSSRGIAERKGAQTQRGGYYVLKVPERAEAAKGF